MIKRQNKDIKNIVRERYPLVKVYYRGYLVWKRGSGDDDTTISSCFGNGYWIDSLPWIDTDGWKDN